MEEEAQETPQLSETELFIRGLSRQAAEAREDIAKFYEFVIREEHSKRLLPPADHQLVLFSFVQHHPQCVLRLPVGTTKTFSAAAIALKNIGNDITQRGAIVSKTQGQAKKPLSMVADYIKEPALNARLIHVFPNLQPSKKSNDPWTVVAITVDRPPGIRDPSLIAAGIDTAIPGSRLSWILTDDLIDDENSGTEEQRQEVIRKFDGRIMSRLDPVGGRAVVTNTPWHRKDLTYHLEGIGWPTLTMDIYGFVRVTNPDASWMRCALDRFLRPSETRFDGRYDWYRLRAHDPDPEETIPLWPERYPLHVIAGIKEKWLPHEFARAFLCEPLSEENARCQKAWVEKCKLRGMGTRLESQYSGPNPTFTGVDIGIGRQRGNDLTVIFTLEALPDGHSKRILNIKSGRYKGNEIVDLVNQENRLYKSAIRVEGNQAQKFIEDFAKEANKNLPIKAIATTTANKHHLEFGVESIFGELQAGDWIIPCDNDGKCQPEVNELINDLLYYDPSKHTADRLMAMWFAREAARKGHSQDPKPRSGCPRTMPHARGF